MIAVAAHELGVGHVFRRRSRLLVLAGLAQGDGEETDTGQGERIAVAEQAAACSVISRW